MAPAPTPASFSGARRWTIRLSVLAAAVSAVALAGMANYLSTRYPWRFYWSSSETFLVSPFTRQVLRSLTNDVKVTVLFRRDEPLYYSVSSLLTEYQRTNPGRLVVEYIDYLSNPSAAERVKQKYRLPPAEEYNVVVFDCEATGSPRLVYQRELSEYNTEELFRGAKEVRRTAFLGELLFTSAIVGVTNPKPLRAYFLQGQGEHDPENDRQIEGYSTFAHMLRQLQVQPYLLRLVGTNEIPADCDLLILAGATAAYPDPVLRRIEQYLEQGGRLLACFRYRWESSKPTGLESVLARWGVAVGDNWVRDVRNSVSQELDIVCTNFSAHPLIRPMHGSQIRLFRPRSIEQLKLRGPSADTPKVDPLIFTGPDGEVFTELTPTDRDRHGAIPLAAAVERGGLQGIRAGRGTSRIVVVGDSLFLSNVVIDQYRNRDFAVLAVNWLLDRFELMGGLGPRPIKEYTLLLTQSQLASIRWVLLGGMPGAVLVLGLLVWWRRRH